MFEPQPVTAIKLQEFLRLYDEEGPLEFLDGEIIPLHATITRDGLALKRLYNAFLDYEQDTDAGEVMSEMTYVLLDSPDWVKGSREPDLMFYKAERLAAYRAEVPDWEDKPFVLVPDFIAEVVSPNDRYSKIYKKIALYLEDGVELIWIIDPQKRTVFVHRSGLDVQLMLSSRDTHNGGDVLPGFEIEIAAIFGE